MFKSLIKFRKKFVLPFKWTRQINHEIDKFTFPEKRTIYMKMQEIKDDILAAERKENENDLAIAEGRLKLLNWFIGK
jgi:hypothetical protein